MVTALSKKSSARFGRIEYDDIMAVIADAPTVFAVPIEELERILSTTPGLGLWDYQKRGIMSAVNRLFGAKMDGDGDG